MKVSEPFERAITRMCYYLATSSPAVPGLALPRQAFKDMLRLWEIEDYQQASTLVLLSCHDVVGFTVLCIRAHLIGRGGLLRGQASVAEVSAGRPSP